MHLTTKTFHRSDCLNDLSSKLKYSGSRLHLTYQLLGSHEAVSRAASTLIICVSMCARMCCWCCLNSLNETSWDPPFHWYIKHIHMHAYMGVSTYTGPGQFLGGSILPPLVTNSNTSWLLRLGYGIYPREKISHSKTPKDLQEADDRIRTGHNKKGGIWEGVPEGILTTYLFLM